MEKPNVSSCDDADSGQLAFCCGRKHKYGIDMQAVCDTFGRYLDIDLSMPGKVSDYLVFVSSDLHDDPEKDKLLAPGLCLFGDNAYVNTSFMATPYKSPKGSEDDYNFHHSQLRITVECSFGMLVNRWGVLRKAIPATAGLKKTTAMVSTLCRLHSYCIDERLLRKGINPYKYNGIDDTEDDIPSITEADYVNLLADGAIPLESRYMNDRSPEPQLLHGGEHFESLTLQAHRMLQRQLQETHKNKTLPRTMLHNVVVDKGLVRPTPKQWKQSQ